MHSPWITYVCDEPKPLDFVLVASIEIIGAVPIFVEELLKLVENQTIARYELRKYLMSKISFDATKLRKAIINTKFKNLPMSRTIVNSLQISTIHECVVAILCISEIDRTIYTDFHFIQGHCICGMTTSKHWVRAAICYEDFVTRTNMICDDCGRKLTVEIKTRTPKILIVEKPFTFDLSNIIKTHKIIVATLLSNDKSSHETVIQGGKHHWYSSEQCYINDGTIITTVGPSINISLYTDIAIFQAIDY